MTDRNWIKLDNRALFQATDEGVAIKMSDDEWDCDFIGGTAKAAASQIDSYKANNRDKKAIPKKEKAILSKKILDDSSFTVRPIKRRQSTEPLKQNTSQNVIRCVCLT